jgi:tRNA-splicing ligase RtcB (3'-phosphate/5'-hydroxy nucleic acid ligase)
MVKLKKINNLTWEIERQGIMKADVRIFASEKLLENIKKDDTLKQAMNMTELSGVLNPVIVLSDAHQGYGACIGGVSAMDLEKGVISPGQIGFDINCGIRLLKTNLEKKDLEGNKKLLDEIYSKIPSGLGRGSGFKLKLKEFNELIEKGVSYLVEKGYGSKKDLENIEENGFISGANSEKVSKRAKQRGIGQLGTLGAGNHFVDVQVVEEIFDKEFAKEFGLYENQVVVMIHTGSRGFGHQVASDYIKLMESEFGYENLPDRQLINAPIKSSLGKDYFSAMACAANFGFCNRHLIAYWIKEVFLKNFPDVKIETLYDVAHNIAKIEEHLVEGKKKKVCVHRKGATRSFDGQPVLIPGSMGTSSYVLVGTKKAEELSFGSTAHGSGRVMSRMKAMKNIDIEKLKKDLKEKNILIRASSNKSLKQESPEVYKNSSDVVEVVDELGISKKVAKLKPLLVVMG